MQSLMGDRLLKLFLKRSRRRLRPAGPEQAESKSGRETPESSLPDEAVAEQAQIKNLAQGGSNIECLVQPRSEHGLQRSLGLAQTSDEPEKEDASLVDGTTSSRNSGKGCE